MTHFIFLYAILPFILLYFQRCYILNNIKWQFLKQLRFQQDESQADSLAINECERLWI